MKIFAELFSDWVGILSLSVIVIMLLMGAFFVYIFITKSATPDE